MIYLARRLDTQELVQYEDDPQKAYGYGEQFLLPLDGHPILCERVITPPQVVATDRRKRFDDAYQPVRSDGRLSTMQLPSQEQVRMLGLPEAPHYNGNGDASFMNRDQAVEYTKKLNDHPGGGYRFDS